jgi:hypothetical protein
MMYEMLVGSAPFDYNDDDDEKEKRGGGEEVEEKEITHYN